MSLYSQLFLRNTTSPYGDFTRNSVLSFKDLDQNFIFLKERDISNISYSSDTLTIETLGGNSFSTTIVNSDTFVTGGTYNPSTVSLDFTGNSGFTPFNMDVSSLTDTYVSGGVYDPNTGCVTFSTTSGYTFDVCGFVTGSTLGSGTGNYITKWTGVGVSTTLGESLIQDNGTSLSIGNTPNNISILDIDTTLQGPFITSTKINVASNQSAYGLSSMSIGTNSLGDNIGVAGFANGNSNRSIGVLGNAVNNVGNINIGGYFTAANGVSNYSVQLIDGTQTVGGGKFLKDTGDGKANWANITASDISGLTSYWTSQTGSLIDTNTTIAHTTLNTNTNSIIGGGQNNKLDNSDNASIIGGTNNNIISGDRSLIIGGTNSDIQSRTGSILSEAGILGGSNNNIVDTTSDSDRSFIIGGVNNDINNAGDSIILSSGLSDITGPSTQYGFMLGTSGSLINSSLYSGIIGGSNNELNGVSRSVILGGQNITGTTSDTVYVPNLNIGTPVDTSLGDTLGQIRFDGIGTSANIQALATENQTGSSLGGKLVFQTTPNSTTTPLTRMEIGNDGVVSIGDTLTSGYQMRVKSTGNNYGGIYSYVNNGNPAGGAVGVLGNSSIIGATGTTGNIGIVGQGYSSNVQNIGVRGTGSGQSISPSSIASYGGFFNGINGINSYGVLGSAGGNNNSTNCYGGRFVANGTKVGGTNYSLWLEDGTEGTGKFLKSVTSNGKANWVNITASDISGLTSYWTSGSSGNYSIKAINDSTTDATGDYAVAEGRNTLASGSYSHAEGWNTIASGGGSSHAEGVDTTASGIKGSHAEGNTTVASGAASHSQNGNTIAAGNGSHAGGSYSTASGDKSFIHSTNSLVTGDRSVVLGGQNITGSTNDTVYVPYLNVTYLSTGTSVNNLGIDSNGNVVSGKTGPDSIVFEIFNTSPTSPDPYTIYDDGNIRLLFDEAATDDIEIVILTNPSTGPVHVVWSEPTAGTSGSANVTTASGQIPLNTEVSADDVVDFVIWAPQDATYPYYEAKVTVSNGTFTSIPAVARVSKWNSPS